jgi:HPt (histidine-containing phosphotransfer) domain-containing protein
MGIRQGGCQTEGVPVLDIQQLKDITMDDAELMQDILATLITDTSRQLLALEHAVEHADATETARLAHYSKGACANVGATSTARILLEIEKQAKAGDLEACGAALISLQREFQKLRSEAAHLTAA